MKSFTNFVFRFRVPILAATTLLTLIFGYCIKDLKINADIISALPKSDPAVQMFNYIGEEYGGNQMAMIALEAKDVFNAETISRINELTNRFREVEGVSSVLSLTNVLDIKKTPDGIEIGKLIDEYNLPKSEEEIRQLKSYVLSRDMYQGRLVSQDSKATLLVCRLSGDADKIKTTRELKAITEEAHLEEVVYYGGLPFQVMDLTDYIVKDLKTLKIGRAHV